MTAWTINQCAEFLGTTRRSLIRWKQYGFPGPIGLDGNSKLYDSREVKEWAAEVGKYDDLVGLPDTSPGQWWKGPDPDTFSTRVAAEMLGYSNSSVRRYLRLHSNMPRPHKRVGLTWVWTAEDVAAVAQWLASRRSQRASV